MKSTGSTLLWGSTQAGSGRTHPQSARSPGTRGPGNSGLLTEKLDLLKHTDTPQTHETPGAIDSSTRIQGEREIERHV